MTYHLQRSWLPVVGQTVQVRYRGQIIREGTVDAVTPEGHILWLAADGPNARQMIERSEGHEIWITYRWETRNLGESNFPGQRFAEGAI